MKNMQEIIIKGALAVCVAVLFLQGYGAQNGGNAYAIAYDSVGPGPGGSEGGGGGNCYWHDNGYGGFPVWFCDGGGGGGYHPPPDIWQQDPPDADGVYAGHPPDKDGLIQPGDLVPDLCKWIYGYHCTSIGRDYRYKQDWTEDPQSSEMYDPYVANPPEQKQIKDAEETTY